MRGGDELLDAFRAAAEGDEDIFVTGFECLGACDIAPMASIDQRYFGPLEAAEAGRAIDQLKAGAEVLPEKALERRPLAGDTPRARRGGDADPRETRVLLEHAEDPALRTIAGYKGYGGYATLEKAYREMEQDEVLKELEDSGLRGRGGAGFSMGKKASFLPRGDMPKYLCCNADESEPGAFKDRELMQRNPHQLIEGIAIAALAADAGHAFIFIRGEYDAQADILDAAVAEAYEAGYLGENILGTHRDLELVVHRGAGAYICGEETALLDALEGKRGNPRLKPPFPAVQGLYGGPTLINNVETLSNVPRIVAHGRRVVPRLRHRAVARDQGRLGLRRRAPPRQLRGRAGDPHPRADLRPRRRPRAGPRGQGVLSRAAPPPRCSPPRRRWTSPTASRRWPRRARCSAPARSSSPTTGSRSRTWRCARRASTTTSPAASAPPAARGRTGR